MVCDALHEECNINLPGEETMSPPQSGNGETSDSDLSKSSRFLGMSKSLRTNGHGIREQDSDELARSNDSGSQQADPINASNPMHKTENNTRTKNLNWEDSVSHDQSNVTVSNGQTSADETKVEEIHKVKNLLEQDNPSDTDESEDMEENEEPPPFKYTRLNQLPSNLFKKDPVSTATLSEKVFIFGTHSGLIHMTTPDFTTIRSFKAHKASILSLYTDGQYFASGSMDGTIVIGSVADSKDIIMLDYKRPIHAVVLDKNYQKSRSFICGGMAGLVIYSSKNWLDKRVDTYLDKDNGPIIAIHISDDLVFWMNDKGITIYHIAARQVISVISKPSDSFRSDLYWPRISFPETDRALIAWGNYIWALRLYTKGFNGPTSGAGSSVKSRILPSTASLSFRSVPEKKVEVEHIFKLDCLVSGIAGFQDDQWVVLAYNQPELDEASQKLVSQSPDLKILNSVDGATIFEEELALHGIESLGLNDYHMLAHIGPTSTRYIILSARDGIVAQQVQLDDRLEWFLERNLFDKAWIMSQHLVSPLKRVQYGVKHLDLLVKKDHWSEAAHWLSRILAIESSVLPVGDNRSTLGTKMTSALQTDETETLLKEYASQWNLWSDIFLKSGHFQELSEIIPLDTRWNLDKLIFTRILRFWLEKDGVDPTFYQLLKRWDIELYDVKIITTCMEHLLERDPDDKQLREQLCKTYESSNEPNKAVPHLCQLKSSNIIEFLNKHHILANFKEDLPKFLKLRFERESDIETLTIPQIEANLKPVIIILVEERYEISPNTVIDLMTKGNLGVVNYLYLERLASIDELLVRGFLDTRVDLFAQFDRAKLLPFLMSNDRYDISKAIEECESNSFTDELVFLLGEIGENKKAISLIVEKLDDPVRAIKFAKARDDADTWELLLNFSYSRPKYIKALLEMADDQSSKYYDPMMILQNMKTDVHIEGLKDSITKMAEDHDMNVIVNQLLLKIVYKRSEEISNLFKKDRLKGNYFSVETPDLQMMSEVYETIVFLLNPQSHSMPQLKLVSRLLLDDPLANTLFTNMSNKLKHIHSLQQKLEKLRQEDDAY